MADRADHRSVLLPRDDASSDVVDPRANGALHWAPLHDDGLSQRMRLIADWVADTRPDAVVVDVSVEVAMLVRLLGVPVVVMAMPGDRIDAPHELVYQIADHIVAAWPKEFYEPPWLQAHSAKTIYVGGISRFDGRPRTPRPAAGRPNVLVLDGAGGSNFDAAIVKHCAAAYPQWIWSSLGVPGGPWLDDPWPALCAADLVVSSAGQSSIADIATAGTPSVVIAAERPFGEQTATSSAVERGGMAVVRHSWPEPADWPALFEHAQALGSHAWERWQTGGAAARTATLIDEVAERRPVGAPR